MKRKKTLLFAGFVILLLLAVISSYLYIFRFERTLCYVTNTPESYIRDIGTNWEFSDRYYAAWQKILPYKKPFFLLQLIISFSLFIYAREIKLITPSLFTKATSILSLLLFLSYLFLGVLTFIMPYGGLIG